MNGTGGCHEKKKADGCITAEKHHRNPDQFLDHRPIDYVSWLREVIMLTLHPFDVFRRR